MSGYRSFADDMGTVWDVWEVRPAHVERRTPALAFGPHLQEGWLAFQSGDDRRRLAPIPSGWQQLGVAELRALLRQSEPVAPRRSAGEDRPSAP